MKLDIVSYESKYDEALAELEKNIVQGRYVQLGIIKSHFLDRTVVFNKFLALLAVDRDDKPVATCIGARTTIGVNGNRYAAGVGYEVKVSREYRNKGVGKMLTRAIYKSFFRPEGLARNFTTLKKANVPIVRLLSKVLPGMWLYEFVYLTIPSQATLKDETGNQGTQQLLTVGLFDTGELQPAYYCKKVSGLAYLNTYMLYQLKIIRVGPLFKGGLWLLKKITPRKYNRLPQAGMPMKFATLYNHTVDNIGCLNEVLGDLQKKNIDYLMVCCRRNDSIFNSLKKLSINTYPYYLLTDFPVADKDEIELDVRCL